MKRYIKLWYIYSIYSTQLGLQSRFGSSLFVIGKFIRFVMFLAFIVILSSSVKEISGYTFWQMVFIFATFNIVDVFEQLFLREVYRFRGYVVSGDIDYFLVRPMKPIFRFLFGGTDILDLPLAFVSAVLIVVAFLNIGEVTLFNVALYTFLVINALLIGLAFHIFVLALGILTTQVDHALWVYRDLTSMGKIPIDLYREPIRFAITFIIPIGIMMTFPAKAAFGTLLPHLVLISFIVGTVSILFSSFSWRFALKRYASASS